MDDLIRRLKDRLRFSPAVEMDAYTCRTNDKGEMLPPYPPRPPVSMAVVEDVERTLGFRLPTLVRRLYTEVADGRYGPSWGVIRLRSPAGTDPMRWWEQPMSVEAWTLHERLARQECPPSAFCPDFPERAIRFCEEGCNISMWLDCTTEAARVFVDDPNSYGDDYAHETVAESLDQWLTAWLEAPWPTTLYPTQEVGS